MAMSDMTLGQYFPAESVIHRLDARIKIVLAIAFMVLAFLVSTLQGYGMVLGLLGVAVLITYSPQNGIILLVLAFLVSPYGLPLAAIWLLGKVQDLKFAIQDLIYG